MQHVTWDDVEQQWTVAFRSRIPRGETPFTRERRQSRLASPVVPSRGASPGPLGPPSPGAPSPLSGAISFRQTIGAAPISRTMTVKGGQGTAPSVEGGALQRLATAKLKRHFI